MGGYALGFNCQTFFIHQWDDKANQFSIMLSVITIGGGLPSSFLGGIIADKYEERIPNIKGLIAGYGAIAACPFLAITYLWQPGFWTCIVSYYCAYFAGEMWYGPAHA